MNHQAKLSERIVQDVVDRLATGRDLPFRLNVLGIAQHYGISRTPVREAIGELLRLGELARLPNGRLTPGYSSPKTSVTVPVTPSLAVSIADTPLDSSGENSTRDNQTKVGQAAIGDSQLASTGRDLDSDSFHRGHHASLIGDTQLALGRGPIGGPIGDSQLASADQCTDYDSYQSRHHNGSKTDSKNRPNVSGSDALGSKLCVPASASHGSAFASDPDFDKRWSQLDWRHDVRRSMIEEIVRLSLRGQTTFLREQIWSERLRIGRGVLRQLLSELAGQGFVEHVARRGWQVRPFDSEAMLQYLEIREVLELHALELAKDRLDPERLRAMMAGNPSKIDDCFGARREPSLDHREVHHIGPATLPETLNNEIHGYLIALSNNRYIADFFARNSTYYSQLFEMATVETGWRDAMATQHREILAALLDLDWPRGKQALAHHIRAQKPVVQQLLHAVRGTCTKLAPEAYSHS